jgi:hypothetical protein
MKDERLKIKDESMGLKSMVLEKSVLFLSFEHSTLIFNL